MGTVRAAFLRKHGWNCVALGFGDEDFRRDTRNVQICVPRLYWGRPAARRVSQYRRATRDTSQDLGWFAAGFMAILPGDQCPVPPAATSNPRKQATEVAEAVRTALAQGQSGDTITASAQVVLATPRTEPITAWVGRMRSLATRPKRTLHTKTDISILKEAKAEYEKVK
jgi:hypothetical protein